MKKNVISFFAGVGGIDIGFAEAGDFETIYANEFDKNAQHTFETNFGDEFLDRRDIRSVNAEEVPNADVLLAGFPCQPFSIAGYRRGLDDERGDLFFETLRIIKEKQPKVVFLENVKNLVTHDHGNTFKVIREFLVHAGYFIKWKVLNAKEYGNIPQNRERIYVVGFKDKEAYERFEFPEKIELTTSLQDIIDFEHETEERYYYVKDKVPFYDELVKEIKSSETVYQWRRQYVRENKNNVVPTLTANMGTGGHNVPLIKTLDGRIRKLTPRETFNAQGYPEDYKLPADAANGSLYKQAGNSVVIPVITRIAEKIDEALGSDEVDLPLPETKDKVALIYTKMLGRMEGASYPVEFFDNREQLIDFVQQGHETGEVPYLEFMENEEFFEAIRKGGNYEFFTELG
ncbi:DNA cytosine methyltransferase [Weissella cibaria]|uniref:DNA cytosine methyltransferase n=1 Tax=Weissella cibaria TaxID=137591 RepID=UPI00223BF0BF|nr:DNA cytosine methyltransferase [Weissella cibaria]MCT0001075.1 DNA cytosine methyltransferase [Weissella cibaria]MDK9678678.1 DNA cytosine methyltransferase [Weissella cibaria]